MGGKKVLAMSEGAPELSTSARILVVEDEFLIRMLLEEMLTDLGHSVAGVAGSLADALAQAKDCDCDVAMLDVNLDGAEVFPVADILAKRKIPFVFVTGYGDLTLPASYENRPTLQKPFQVEELNKALARLIAQKS
jgi:CheY-like chemotaxis protein